MILLNFSHPLTPTHLSEIEMLLGQPIARLVDVPTQFDVTQPFAPQAMALADAAGLTPEDWQTEPILLNPPALSSIAVTLLAELHGRMGYFPPILRLRQVDGALPPRFEVAEVINLQIIREQARLRRQEPEG